MKVEIYNSTKSTNKSLNKRRCITTTLLQHILMLKLLKDFNYGYFLNGGNNDDVLDDVLDTDDVLQNDNVVHDEDLT